ncbi:MAG: hypothetical protein A3D24_04955 [Candidatus Blackburnbacteria bacterium RIFCSPHIGHO2_02_FULL_39_13]|uniref:Cell shape-determining protein MreC n=1 Tax=Candidatus Blackburnbacteria bacterium RIFCSPLOWO2_01_FULL_40_20 TaxID=1797519 RepID=A0A1G1VBA4_9BACT|nr:MAG: Cell shape-determining protein MreC [Microgenomates group bacterium GW2011_GWA2_39_19]OGY07133.1 MAG: hypothetical protein A2694_03625 [Candidatus Blackburnbacteria bacterium RIFCSPHIGHO2_01_FULL_40_17]OGY08955.1 MAG: hypothetical protein A3D24_04955 [Candidatus Blackburnbacteria bacterium RIFCSPHIGHO2_02_FULL_39_13]OGY12699.1 MAG: hypothetical protein A3A77_00190 [Candidatus Blackburnbacteria bacterium RIFCSPLOWO2_01_FULL_40_20]OGY15193.1 MAG: hypothetical protein A3I52_02070 [Candidat
MQTVKKESYLIFLCYVLSFLLLFLDINSKVVFLHTSSRFLADPVQSRLFKIKSFVLSPFGALALGDKEKLGKLELKIAELNSLVVSFKTIEEENVKMRKLLGADVPSNWQFAPARVVWANGDSVSVYADINTKKETPVVATSDLTKGGVLVGRVEESFGRNHKVLLPSAPNIKISVTVRGTNGDKQSLLPGNKHASGIIEGKGGKIMLGQVLAADPIGEGDLVVTSGDSGFPPDLLIGYVKNITTNTNLASKEAEVAPAVNVTDLDYVFFVTKY